MLMCPEEEIAEEEDALSYDVPMLSRLLEVAQERGQWGRAEELRARLAGLAPPDEPIGPAPTILEANCDLPFSPDLVRWFQERGLDEVAKLAPVTYKLLRTALPPKKVDQIRHRLTAKGYAGIVGSAKEVLGELPEKSVFAVDICRGIKPELVLAVLESVADGKRTQRQASEDLGGMDKGRKYGKAHQRFGRALNQYSHLAVEFYLRAMSRDYGRAEWFVGAGKLVIPEARRCIWGLEVTSRWPIDRTANALDRVAKLNAGRGRGVVDRSWRGVSILFRRGK